MMKAQMKGISLMIILLMLVLTVQAAALRGTVTDKATNAITEIKPSLLVLLYS